jgi:flavin reductase (DIM6/NTAB) family NADH-FMN oxidoreductase RutF
MKREKPPATDLLPTPVVLVTTQGMEGPANIITLAWAGVVNSDPPMVGIGIRPDRHSYKLLLETGEFCVNLPSQAMVRAVDVCGVVSGKDTDKFAFTGLEAEKASKVKPPLIRQCPVNLECRVVHRLDLGSHTLFIGEILTVHREESILDGKGKISVDQFMPLAYCPGAHDYRALGKKLGWYGFSKGKMS